MKTVIINDKIKPGKLLLEFLKTQPWAMVKDEKKPNEKTKKAFEDIEKGRTYKTESLKDLYKQLDIL